MTDPREGSHPDLTAYIFGLPDDDLQFVREHLRSCTRCSKEVQELGDLPNLMGAAAPEASVPSSLERRVLAALDAQEIPSRQQPWSGGGARSKPAREDVLRGALERLGLGQVGRRIWVPGIAAAAAAMVLILAVAVVTVGLGQSAGAPGGAQSTVQTVRLVSTDGSAASGTASVQRGAGGQVVELKVSGLPQTSPGQLYVCWLVDEGDSLEHQNRVAVGTFSVNGPGPVTVRWSTGVDAGQYRLDVTREQADGNPIRRGPEVLTAVR